MYTGPSNKRSTGDKWGKIASSVVLWEAGSSLLPPFPLISLELSGFVRSWLTSSAQTFLLPVNICMAQIEFTCFLLELIISYSMWPMVRSCFSCIFSMYFVFVFVFSETFLAWIGSHTFLYNHFKVLAGSAFPWDISWVCNFREWCIQFLIK